MEPPVRQRLNLAIHNAETKILNRSPQNLRPQLLHSSKQTPSTYVILNQAMKLLLGIFALILAAVSLFADYKWRQWIAARKREHDR